MTKYPDYIRQKAIQLRTEKNMTVDEIADNLKIAKSTAHEWVKHIPIPRTQAQTEAQQQNAEIIRKKHEKIRHLDYQAGFEEASELLKDSMFRDFVTLYVAEGSKTRRNEVEIGNSDASVMKVSTYFLRKYKNPERGIQYRVQIHEDHDPDEIKAYWAEIVGIQPEDVTVSRKSNSGQMDKRQFRSEYGVLAVRVYDTSFRSRLGGWMDYIKKEWSDFADSRMGDIEND